eukprot:gene376-58_t
MVPKSLQQRFWGKSPCIRIARVIIRLETHLFMKMVVRIF